LGMCQMNTTATTKQTMKSTRKGVPLSTGNMNFRSKTKQTMHMMDDSKNIQMSIS
jgi:hypothetical protein